MILHDHIPCRLSPLGLLGACLLLLFAVPSWSKAQPASTGEDLLATVPVAISTSERSLANDETNDDDDRKKEIESKFGPDSEFEKKVEKLGEKIGKEIEAKFGPGSDFEKKMEAFGKEMEAKFGEDSGFARKMEAFGKEMEARFGAGSDFEKKMNDLGEDMKKKYGPGSEFAKNLKDKVDVDIKAKKRTGEKQPPAKSQTNVARTEAANRKTPTRQRRIEKLEAQIRELVDEIKALKAEDSKK